MFRINPYLQQPSSDGIYITWFTENNISSEVSITGPGLNSPLTFTTNPTFEPVLSYTDAELNQEIAGLEPGSWLLGDENYKHTVDLSNLFPDSTYQYSVTVGDDTFESSFETAPTAEDWDEIRFVVLSDSETEPRGRVNRRDWQQGALEEESLPRPEIEGSLWEENIGVSGDRLNYPLTENVGYRNNLEIINSREPDFLMMPGDLIQGGGYQPAWDEFFRHNAGEFDSGLSEYAILPALGNWENFGALNGGYGVDADGRYGPLFGRQKYHVYFDAPANGTPEHQDNYYRTDYGPITILTLDSSNGEPDDNRDNYGGEGQPPQISGQEYTGSGTDTQANITREQYEAAGGTDLADFNPGSPQWNWVKEQLELASEQGQIVFAQFHHAPYSNGTHGLPMNHENSSGQGGTPMRQYQPIFEEYGVVAVFSGHSEMFERSFVDEDNDGEGVYYYDVGVAGDGMRGQRTDEEGNLLSYNQFSQWTADQDEPELWQEVDGVLQNVAGGKHYGHLEVNLENLEQEDKTRITFTPVYSFPLLDANYNLIDTERRVYGDEIVIELDNTSATPELSPVGTPGDDDIFPIPNSGFDGIEDILFTGAGRDSVDLILGASANVEDNRIFLGSEDDTIYVKRRDRVFGGTGNDRFDATDAEGGNRMSGGAGDDVFYLGSNDRALGGDGDDQFFVQVGGGNLIAGGEGADRFWIVNVELPQAANTIVDFQVGTDVIGVNGAVGLGITTSTLELSQVGSDTHVSFDNQTLAVLTGIQAVSLDVSNASQFVLM
ncbi:MAG: metallophosphoesterase [Sphaerospermopsis sp. SIO1G2]|nr:metallophosphoesterase [Sphaerospermopsis sp. SIO1G2]